MEDLQLAGTTVLPRRHLAGSRAVYIAHIGARAFAEIDPSLSEEITGLLARDGRNVALTASVINDVVPQARVLSIDNGFIFHLVPERLVVWAPGYPITLRPLTEGDLPALENLSAQCDPTEVEDAFVAIDHELAYACFDGERMVAAGSGYRRNGFMDLGVLTDPGYRGRRLAPSTVSSMAQASVQKDIIPQYRCDKTNVASRRVAEVTGFSLYYVTEAVHLLPA